MATERTPPPPIESINITITPEVVLIYDIANDTTMCIQPNRVDIVVDGKLMAVSDLVKDWQDWQDCQDEH